MLNKERLDQSKLLQLVDWQFTRYLSMQLLPLLYLLLIVGDLVLVGFIVANSFETSLLYGLATTLVSPLMFLVIAAIIRAALEYLVMAHRTMKTVESMSALSGKVDGMSDRLDKISTEVTDIHEALMQLRPLLRSAGLPGRLLELLRIPSGTTADATATDKGATEEKQTPPTDRDN